MSSRISGLIHARRFPDKVRQHAVREQRLDEITDAVEQFAYSLGLMIAGHDPQASAAPDLTRRLQHELQPFLDRGDAMRPDFGAFGDLRVEGELLESSTPMLATLEFDDRCLRETAAGRIIPARARRLRITMHVGLDPVRIIDCAVAEVRHRA